MFSFNEVLTRINDSPYKYSVLLLTTTPAGFLHFTPMVYESADEGGGGNRGGEDVVEQRDDEEHDAATQEPTAAERVAAEAEDDDERTEDIVSDNGEDPPVAVKEWNRYLRLIREQLGECDKMMLTMCHTHT